MRRWICLYRLSDGEVEAFSTMHHTLAEAMEHAKSHIMHYRGVSVEVCEITLPDKGEPVLAEEFQLNGQEG